MATTIIGAVPPAFRLDQDDYLELLGMVQSAYDELPKSGADASRKTLDVVLQSIIKHREQGLSAPSSREDLRREAASLSAVLHYSTQATAVLREIRDWASGDPALGAKLSEYNIAYNEPCIEGEYEQGANHLFYRLRNCIDQLGAA